MKRNVYEVEWKICQIQVSCIVNSRNDRLLFGYISVRTMTPGSSLKEGGEETFVPELLA